VYLYPLSIIALFLFTAAVTLWVSAMNVRYRDVEHLLALALLVWFWFTPIVYSSSVVHSHFVLPPPGVDPRPWVWTAYLLNPLSWVMIGLQGALYNGPDAATKLAPLSQGTIVTGLLVVIAGSAVLLLLTWRTFFARSGDFAEEL